MWDIKYDLLIMLYIQRNIYCTFAHMCKCETDYMADTRRTFLDASELNHNALLLLGAVKSTGGRGGRGGGGDGGEEREGEAGRGGVKFREGMLTARWKVEEEEDKPKEERRWEAEGGGKPGRTDTRARKRKRGRKGRGGCKLSPEKEKTKGLVQKSTGQRGNSLERRRMKVLTFDWLLSCQSKLATSQTSQNWQDRKSELVDEWFQL